MTAPTTRAERVAEARARIAEFLRQRDTMRGLDPEDFLTANYAVLRRSDLATVLAALDASADAQAAVERATALAGEWERRAAEERSSDPAAVELLRGAARSLRRALAGDHADSETP